MFDFESDNRYFSNTPLKQEDCLARLQGKLARMVTKFVTRYNDLVEKKRSGKGQMIKDEFSKSHLSVAIYLATYLDVNESSKAYFNVHK